MKRIITLSMLLACAFSANLSAEETPAGAKTVFIQQFVDEEETRIPIKISIEQGRDYQYKMVSLAEYVQSNMKVDLSDAGYAVVQESDPPATVHISGTVRLDKPQYSQANCKPQIKWFDFVTAGVTYFGEYLLPPDWRTRDIVCSELNVAQKISAHVNFTRNGEVIERDLTEEVRAKKSAESDLVKGLSLKLSAAIVRSLKELPKPPAAP